MVCYCNCNVNEVKAIKLLKSISPLLVFLLMTQQR